MEQHGKRFEDLKKLKLEFRKKVKNGQTLLRNLSDLGILIRADVSNLKELCIFLDRNKDIYGAMVTENKNALVPLDLRNDTIYVKFLDYTKFIKGGVDVYIQNKDYKYVKTELRFNSEERKIVSSRPKEVEKVRYSNIVRDRLIERYDIKLPKDNDKMLLIRKLRREYETRTDKDISELAEWNGLTLDSYNKLIGNPSRVKDEGSGLYRAFQQRIAIDFNKGLSFKEIETKYETSKNPILRAIKEQNNLITDPNKLEQLVIRSFKEGLLATEIMNYYNLKNRGYSKERVILLREEHGLKTYEDLLKSELLSESEATALYLYRKGVSLLDLVNGVQEKLGRELTEDRYWRAYTRILLGVTMGYNSRRLDFEKDSEECRAILFSESRGGEDTKGIA